MSEVRVIPQLPEVQVRRDFSAPIHVVADVGTRVVYRAISPNEFPAAAIEAPSLDFGLSDNSQYLALLEDI